GDRGGTRAGDLYQFAARMGPAIGERDVRSDATWCDQPVVARITIDLKNAAKALQDPFCMKATSARGIGEGNTGWCGAIPGAIITGQSPEVSGLGLSGPRIEHRCAGFVHEQLR